MKIILANEATSMLHGKDEATKCEKTAKKTFIDNSTGEGLPVIRINKKILDDNINILDLIIIAKLEKSKSEARRLVKGNAVKINNRKISEEKFIISKNLFIDNFLKLSLGKKRHIKIEII